MKFHAIATAGAMVLLTTAAQAASLCNCCGTSTVAACSNTCAPIKVAQGQCVAAVDFDGQSEISDGVNPLYDLSLRNIWLGSLNRDQLENFRKLLESARKGVEKGRKSSLRVFASKKIDKATAAANAKRYDDAIVNYYLGQQSYRDAFSMQ